MADRIQAISEYRPRLSLTRRIDTQDLAEFIAMRTGVSEGSITQVLLELRDTITFFLVRGQPVNIEGLGTYTPNIDLAGRILIGYRADVKLKQRVGAPGSYRGEIRNRERIGSSSEDLVAQWNELHPDDPIA